MSFSFCLVRFFVNSLIIHQNEKRILIFSQFFDLWIRFLEKDAVVEIFAETLCLIAKVNASAEVNSTTI